MSYKNDHLLVIVNKYGLSSGEMGAELYETYDKIRDLTVSGSAMSGSGLGPVGGFLMEIARLVAPSSFMPILGNNSINLPGTSYSTPASGGNSILPGGSSAFGFGQLGNYPGFPTGSAANLSSTIGSLGLPLALGIGSSLGSLANNSIGGVSTGAAASITAAGSAGAVAGTAAGYGAFPSLLLPSAGIIAGIGGMMTSLAPYAGPFGLGASVAGNLLQGYGGSVLAMYQSASGRILNNADMVLQSKVLNIETVKKQLDTQTDVLRKMLKESIDGDSKVIQNL